MRLHFHWWCKIGSELGHFGMGLEWFDILRCRICGRMADQLRGEPWSRQIRTTAARQAMEGEG